MGAWIEILKKRNTDKAFLVAPLVGAWIEIFGTGTATWFLIVAPLVGAWIEIILIVMSIAGIKRRSSRGSVD